jgi:hypothetical protein
MLWVIAVVGQNLNEQLYNYWITYINIANIANPGKQMQPGP